jgi:hypothetical protein
VTTEHEIPDDLPEQLRPFYSFLHSMSQSFLRQLAREGVIKVESHLDRDSLLREAAKVMLEDWEVGDDDTSGPQIQGSIDYTEGILKAARGAEQAIVRLILYATWCEHWINGMLIDACQGKELHGDVATLLIRKLGPVEKASQGWNIVGLPEIDKADLQLLRQVFDARNRYVHYKFPAAEVGSNEPRVALVDAAEKAEKLVSALLEYEDRTFHAGRASDLYENWPKWDDKDQQPP